MKKRVLTVLLTSFLTLNLLHSYAQTGRIRGGLNLVDQLQKDDDDSYNDITKINAGFHLGFSYDLPISDVLSIEPGLMVNTRGFRVKTEINSSVNVIQRFNAIYIDLPVYLKYTKALNNSSSFYAAGGAYLGVGMGGRVTVLVETDGDKENEGSVAIDWGNDEDLDTFKALDAGLSLGAGFQFAEFGIGTYYDLGLANISVSDENGTTIRNRVFRLSLTYSIF